MNKIYKKITNLKVKDIKLAALNAFRNIIKFYKKNLILSVFVSIIVVLGFSAVLFLFILPTPLRTIENSEVVTMEKCGVSIKYPKIIGSRPIIAYEPTDLGIKTGSGFFPDNFTEALVIGNPHAFPSWANKKRINNISIYCYNDSGLNFVNNFAKDRVSLSSGEFNNITNWSISNKIFNITEDYNQSVLTKKFPNSIEEDKEYVFSYKGKTFKVQISYSSQLVNKVSIADLEGLFANQIDIGSAQQPTVSKVDLRLWTEDGITLSKKEYKYKLNFNENKSLDYTETAYSKQVKDCKYKTENECDLEDSSFFLNAEANFEGKQIFSFDKEFSRPFSILNESPETGPYFNYKLINSNNFYSIHLANNTDYNANRAIKNPEIFAYDGQTWSSFNGGQTWINKPIPLDDTSYSNEESDNQKVCLSRLNTNLFNQANSDHYNFCGLMYTYFLNLSVYVQIRNNMPVFLSEDVNNSSQNETNINLELKNVCSQKGTGWSIDSQKSLDRMKRSDVPAFIIKETEEKKTKPYTGEVICLKQLNFNRIGSDKWEINYPETFKQFKTDNNL